MLYIMILIGMTFLGSLASYCFKLASGAESIVSILKNKNLYIGGFLYVVAASLNIVLLRFLPYSVVLPLTSLAYIWTMLISHKMLGEKITSKKIFGTCMIVIGAVLIGLF